MNSEPALRQATDLEALHRQLQALYRLEYPSGAPPLFLRLLPRLPAYIRALVERKLNLIVEEETGEKKSFFELDDSDQRALALFLDAQVLRALLDVGRDSALSNEQGHFIAHFDTQPPIVAHQLISVASSENPSELLRMGCVFFDVDGTKTIVDCTSHSHAGKYLEALAEFLCKPPENIRAWLLERGISSEAYSVAGDEFIVLLRSQHQTIDRKTLDEFALLAQTTMAADPALSAFVSFDDPEFVMEYDDWTDEDRAAYGRDSASMQHRLMSSRSKLPDRFIPSVSCGSATFLEALDEALSPDTEEAKTLEELGVNAFRLMVATADARLKDDKRIFRSTLVDQKLRGFLLRNAENRRLTAEIEQLRARIADLTETIHLLRE